MKKLSTYTLAYAGVLIAMNIVLSRFIAIPVGPTLRITVSQVPIILCGMWFGPVIGGISGFLGDLIGSLISGYAPNPFISVSATLMGLIPGLFAHFMIKGTGRTEGFARTLLVIACAMMITSQGFTTYGLSVLYGMKFTALWITRIPQSILLCIVNSFLVNLLYSKIPVPGKQHYDNQSV